MAIHVQDEETDWIVRDFARRRGLGITAAIRTAVQEASANDINAGEALAIKLEPIVRLVRENRADGATEGDKEFMNDMWDEPK